MPDFSNCSIIRSARLTPISNIRRIDTTDIVPCATAVRATSTNNESYCATPNFANFDSSDGILLYIISRGAVPICGPIIPDFSSCSIIRFARLGLTSNICRIDATDIVPCSTAVRATATNKELCCLGEELLSVIPLVNLRNNSYAVSNSCCQRGYCADNCASVWVYGCSCSNFCTFAR